MDSILAFTKVSKFPTLRKYFVTPCGFGVVGVTGFALLSAIVPLFIGILDGGGAGFAFAYAAIVLSYGLVILVPAIALWAKRGWKAGISVILFEVLWMAVIALLIARFFPSPEITY